MGMKTSTSVLSNAKKPGRKGPAFPSIPQFYSAQKQKKRTSPVGSSIGCGRLGLNLVDVLGVHVSVGAILESDLRPVAVKLDNLHNIAAMDDVDGIQLGGSGGANVQSAADDDVVGGLLFRGDVLDILGDNPR